MSAMSTTTAPIACFETIFDTRRLPFLEDHRVHGTPVVPPTTYLEMALAGALAALGPSPCRLEHSVFHEPMPISEEPRRVRLVISAGAASERLYEVLSRPDSAPEDAPWTHHAKGRVVPMSGEPSSIPSLSGVELLTRNLKRVTAENFLEQLEAQGRSLGPRFRALQELTLDAGRAVGQLALPLALGDAAHDYQFHPALFEACIDVLRAAVTFPTLDYRLASVREFRLFRHAVPPLRSHAHLLSGGPGGPLKGDIHITDSEGRLVAELRGVQLERDAQPAANSDTLSPTDALHYQVRWQPQPRTALTLPSPAAGTGRWLVLSDGGGLRNPLAAALAARGDTCFVAVPGERYGRAADGTYHLPAHQPDALRQLLRDTLASGPLHGILSLSEAASRPGEEPTPEQLEAMLRDSAGGLLGVLQALSGEDTARAPRLWCITRGAQLLEGDAAPATCVGAALWGLGRVAALEHPAFWGGLIDLPGRPEAGDVEALVRELVEPHQEEQLALRGGKRYVPRLVRSQPTSPPRPLLARPDATYLITGGLGGLGLEVAQWLASRGARHLILLGRTGLPERGQWSSLSPGSQEAKRVAKVQRLEQQGVRVVPVSADVSNSERMTALFARWARELPPLRGIVHAAGHVQPQALRALDMDTLLEVCRPKALGALLLDRLAPELDFFVSFSSGASIWGSSMLGHYAVANAFLDAFAYRQAARGRRALTVNWAMWDEVGMSSDAVSKHLLTRVGLRAMRPRDALAALEHLITTGARQGTVADMDWSVFRRVYESNAPRRKFLEQVEKPLVPPAAQAAPLRAQEDIDAWLAEHVSELVGIRPEQLDPEQALSTLGIDSISGLGLKNTIAATFQVELPVVLFLQGVTTRDLSARIAEHLASEPRTATGQPHALAPATPVIPRRPAQAPLRPSSSQERLWFLEQLDPGSPLYNVPTAIRVEGPLQVALLERAFNEIIRRHEALRTSFDSEAGMPVARVAPSLLLSIPRVDLRGHSDREREVERLAREEARQPFDLARGPLLRAQVLQLGDREHVVLLTMHHIISDGWSMGVLIHEFTTLYRAFSVGHASPLPQLPLQFSDYAWWQSQRLQGGLLEERLGYWRRQLEGAPPLLELPTDRPRPAVRSTQGGLHPFTLPPELVARVGELCRSEGVTLYVSLLTAYQVLLARYSGHRDICVGSPIAGREHPELQGLIGFFVNTLVLRTRIPEPVSFRALCAQVRQTVLEAIANQELPFEQLVAALQPQRSLGYTPLFQACMALQNSPMQALELPDLKTGLLGVDPGVSKFDLLLTMTEAGGGLNCTLEYSSDLFDRETIARMAHHFERLLASIVTEPDRNVFTLPMLPEDERRQLLVDWNPPRAFPKEPCVHQLFEAQAARTPDAVAVTCEGEHLTYGELNRRANQLAHHLRGRGVGPEVLVGLCLERSLELMVGLLAILKAGGAYLPLDLTYPKDRVAFMLEDANVPVLLTQERLVAGLPREKPILRLDADWEQFAREPDHNPVSHVTPENLIYVIYTSGSTGRPKGVQLCHSQVTRLFTATEPWYHFGPDDVWTLFHSSAFDFSVWEIWGALIHGGRLVVVPYAVSRSPQAFHELLRKEKVTVLNQTPSAFRQLIQADEVSGAARELSLRWVIFGGEALEFGSLKPWFDTHGDQRPRLVNMYGITETTVHVTYRPISAAEAEGTAASIVGVPIPDLQVYVLDAYGELAPVGVIGELYVGGEGLARGYLNRPELTSQRFVVNPFSAQPNARLYRTGDLGRWRSTGELEYLGRIDNQVKLRGFRIELGEIESALGQHPRVREVVVVVREDSPGDKRIVAYLVGSGGAAPGASELREFLKQKMPDYMVPAAFVALSALPLTGNGKVDRRALPSPQSERPQLKQPYVAPRSGLEERLAALWQELLGVDQVGILDDFFELGGHSLLAMRMLARVEKDFGKRMPVSVLFQAPNVEALARTLRTDMVEQTPHLVEIQAGTRGVPFFCVHPSGGEVLCYGDLVRALGPDLPFYGLRAEERGGEEFPADVEVIAARYVKALRTQQPSGPYFLGGWSFGGLVAFEMARQLELQGDTVAFLALIDTSVPGTSRPAPEEMERLVGSLFIQDLAGTLGLELPAPEDAFWSRDLEQQLESLASDGGNLEVLRQRLRVFRAAWHAMWSYSPRPYRGPVTLLKAADGHLGGDPSASGWEALTRGTVEVVPVPGDHYSIMRPPFVEALARALLKYLQHAEEEARAADARRTAPGR